MCSITAVFPTDGRAASITRLPGLSPEYVSSSRNGIPVGILVRFAALKPYLVGLDGLRKVVQGFRHRYCRTLGRELLPYGINEFPWQCEQAVEVRPVSRWLFSASRMPGRISGGGLTPGKAPCNGQAPSSGNLCRMRCPLS